MRAPVPVFATRDEGRYTYPIWLNSCDGPGVYFAYRDEDSHHLPEYSVNGLIYIGYSANVRRRLGEHWRDRIGPKFLRVTMQRADWISCNSAREAAAFEADLIELLDPPLNRRREPEGGQVRDFR